MIKEERSRKTKAKREALSVGEGFMGKKWRLDDGG